jgi:hypothetical protein
MVIISTPAAIVSLESRIVLVRVEAGRSWSEIKLCVLLLRGLWRVRYKSAYVYTVLY